MAAKVVEIADAIANVLEGASFLNGVAIERVYNPNVENREDVSSLRVFVIPQGMQTTRGGSRESIAARPTYLVGFMQAVTIPPVNSEIDGLLDLMQQTAARLYGVELLDDGTAVSAIDYPQLFEPSQLSGGVFQSALSVEVLTFV